MKRFKKILKWSLIVIMHIAIAVTLCFIGDCIGAICDDIVPGWTIDGYIGGIMTAAVLVVYWLKKATKKLESK